MNSKKKHIPIPPTDSEKLDEAVKNTLIPKFYANGALSQINIADSTIMFKFFEEPICIISMSIPLLKSLNTNLSKMLKSYEEDLVEVHSIEELKSKAIESNV